VQNYADTGFQFERLVTGGQLDGRHGLIHHESMQLMRIGTFNVLFAADVDAVDAAGRVVEIKSGNPRFFGSKVARARLLQYSDISVVTLRLCGDAWHAGHVPDAVIGRSVSDSCGEARFSVDGHCRAQLS
jgi:hypothetical protein